MFQISNYEIVNALKGKASKERNGGNEKKKGRNGRNERKEVKKRKEREGKGREGVVVIDEIFLRETQEET